MNRASREYISGLVRIIIEIFLAFVAILAILGLIGYILDPKPDFSNLEGTVQVKCISVIGHRDTSSFIFETAEGEIYSGSEIFDTIFIEGRTYDMDVYSGDTNIVKNKDNEIYVYKTE